MPIKDQQTRREYFKNYMAKKRKGLTVKPELIALNPIEHVKPVKPENGKPRLEMANPKLTQLIQEWQTQINYSCASNCAYAYCNNCWYFNDDQLVDYKGL